MRDENDMTVSTCSLFEDARVVGDGLCVDIQQRRAWDVSVAVLGFEDTKGHCSVFVFCGIWGRKRVERMGSTVIFSVKQVTILAW